MFICMSAREVPKVPKSTVLLLEVDHSDGKRQLERKDARLNLKACSTAVFRLNESVTVGSGKTLQLSK